MGFLRQLSERLLRVLAQHDNTTTSMGTPVSLQGRSLRGGLFWVLFWAVAKEYLARGANTAMPNEITTVNAINA